MIFGNPVNLIVEHPRVKKDAADLEEQISKAEAEKTSRDHAMRSINDEISGLDELISKLNKEKKFFQVNYLITLTQVQILCLSC